MCLNQGIRDTRFLGSPLRYLQSVTGRPLAFSPKVLRVERVGNSLGLCIPRISPGRRCWEVRSLLARQSSHSNSKSRFTLFDLGRYSTSSAFYSLLGNQHNANGIT
jgi:hypothetical protein